MGDFTNFPARCHGPVPHECETAMTGNPLISPENGYCVVSSTFSDDASSWALFGSVSGCVGAKWEQISVTGPSAPAVPATAPALARNVDGYGSAIRLLGPRAGGLARRVRRWARDERDVYVYFDNDVKVGAPFDALSLMCKLRLHWHPRATTGTSLARHSSGALMPGVS